MDHKAVQQMTPSNHKSSVTSDTLSPSQLVVKASPQAKIDIVLSDCSKIQFWETVPIRASHNSWELEDRIQSLKPYHKIDFAHKISRYAVEKTTPQNRKTAMQRLEGKRHRTDHAFIMLVPDCTARG
jgi:hypothetical protein